jgi:DNA-binding CsgD family transcriptional regulator
VLNFQLKEIYLSFIFLIMMIISGFDLMLDYSEGTDFNHVAQEAVVLSLSLIALAWLLIDMRRQSIKINNLRNELSDIKKSPKIPDKYVVDAKTNLSSVISQQFNDWKLSNSEKDVGWLLLKGLSLKEIAALRETLEKTVRQQASAIYKKADLNGRHAFSAWFIEEVL